LRADRIVEASAKPLSAVSEITFYPAQFSILLRERMQGKPVAEVAEFLGVSTDHVNRLLAGQWRPTEGICKKMGLKMVYAMTEQSGA
jgi:hypothetical protein